MDTPDITVLKGINDIVFLKSSSGMKTLKEKGKHVSVSPAGSPCVGTRMLGLVKVKTRNCDEI